MSILTESGLRFQFDSSWRVLKFDQHRFYRYLSGHGLKGIDFLGIHRKKEHLLLVEVKNFTPSHWQGQNPDLPELLKAPEAYTRDMIRKFSDSLRLLQVINDYYRQKWWLRKYLPLLENYLPAFWAGKWDALLWTKVYQIVEKHPERVKLVLWLELEEASFRQYLTEAISLHFSPKGYTFVLASRQDPLGDLWVL